MAILIKTVDVTPGNILDEFSSTFAVPIADLECAVASLRRKDQKPGSVHRAPRQLIALVGVYITS